MADMKQTIAVRIEPADNPLLYRAYTIMKNRIEQRCPVTLTQTDSAPQLILDTATDWSPDAFRIDQVGNAVRVTGGSPRGLLYGVGKLLRTSRYDGSFTPSTWRGTSVPQGSVRGMYFATHFHNWYHVASADEITRYTEDLALWGVNAIMAIFPMINLQDWNDPHADSAMTMLRQYAKATKDLGLLFTTSVNNTMFRGAPDHIRATPLPDPTRRRGNSGHPICPSLPEGHDYLMANARTFFERLSGVGVDLLCYWPYDEGGCACEKCAPWGCNGYLNISRDFTLLAREFFPNVKTVLSTWMFDTPPEGEWQGLSDRINTDAQWINYILADAHEDFPRYPLDVGVPGKRPLLNFPEISMWGNSPWGGVGANPLPSRFQRLWNQVKHLVEGGFPYSEGIYEDMNKAIVSQFYWNRDLSAKDTLSEYIAYEFHSDVTNDVLAMLEILEEAASLSYKKQPVDAAKAQQAYALAEATHDRLPEWAKQNWRWEILRLRALLDHERFVVGNLDSPEAENALLRLIDIYHCQLETDDPYHHRVRPPSKKAKSTAGEH